MSHAYIAEKKSGGILKGALWALFLTVALSLFSIAISSVLLLRAESPSAYIDTLGILLPMLASLFGGAVSAKLGGAGAVSGIIHGAVFTLLLYLLSLLMSADVFSLSKTVVFYTVLILVSALGGVLGARKKGKKRRKRR